MVGNNPNIVQNLPGPIRSYPVKENHFGSAVNKILWYTQTDTDKDRQYVIYLYLYIYNTK